MNVFYDLNYIQLPYEFSLIKKTVIDTFYSDYSLFLPDTRFRRAPAPILTSNLWKESE